MTEEGGALAKIAKAIASVHPAGCTDDEGRAIVGAIAEAGYAVVPVDAFHALDASHVALDDWLHTYAPDECRDEHVETTRARIFEAGGTLAYIADLQQENRRVLNEIDRAMIAATPITLKGPDE